MDGKKLWEALSETFHSPIVSGGVAHCEWDELMEHSQDELDRVAASFLAKLPHEQTLQRPACFEFAMDFIGDPEQTELRKYIEALERAREPGDGQ